jgi:hypothetical protein
MQKQDMEHKSGHSGNSSTTDNASASHLATPYRNSGPPWVSNAWLRGGDTLSKPSEGGMSDQGTSVTLIFYKVGPDWWREPALNLIAAAAQFSSYTHVELAVGETAGSNGQMANVVRIFNDPHGVVSKRLPALPNLPIRSSHSTFRHLHLTTRMSRACVHRSSANAPGATHRCVYCH